MVSFGEVRIRSYPMILGNNPATKIGAPVCIDWEFSEECAFNIEDFEKSRKGKRRRNPHHFYLSYYRRIDILESAGYSKKELKKAERQVQLIQTYRNFHYYWSFPILVKHNVTGSLARQKTRRYIRNYRAQMNKKKRT